MDITFKTEEGRFNYRVCAIIIHNNTLLAMHDERSPYYYLPGGRVCMQETAEDAIRRELKEELQIEAEIIRPLWLNQSFFTEDVNHERYHELCLYYLVDVSNTDLLSRGNPFVVKEKRQALIFEWLEFRRLKQEYFYPNFLKEKIFELPDQMMILTENE